MLFLDGLHLPDIIIEIILLFNGQVKSCAIFFFIDKFMLIQL